MASESKDAVFKNWRRLTGQDRALSLVWETTNLCFIWKVFPAHCKQYTIWKHKFTAPLPQINTFQLFLRFSALTYVSILEAHSTVFSNRGRGGSVIVRSLVGGSGGILHQKMFKSGGSKILFSALVMRSVSKKSTLNIKMANNLLQVTIIKITEPKEKSSILRLYVCGLWLCFVTDQKLN